MCVAIVLIAAGDVDMDGRADRQRATDSSLQGRKVVCSNDL